jgi:hypothetical protein
MAQSARYLSRSLVTGARDRVICSGYIRFQTGTSEGLIAKDRLHAEPLDTPFRLAECISLPLISDSLRNMAATRGRLGRRLKGVGGSRAEQAIHPVSTDSLQLVRPSTPSLPVRLSHLWPQFQQKFPTFRASNDLSTVRRLEITPCLLPSILSISP